MGNYTAKPIIISKHHHFKKVFSIFLLIMVTGCTVQSGPDIPEEIKSLENLTLVESEQGPIHDITFEPRAQFGDSEDAIIGRYSALTLDKHETVYIGDDGMVTVHVFTPDGNYAGSIGRDGDGPGEFRRVRGIKADNGYLYVMDTRSYKMTLFDIETGDVVHSFNIPFEPAFASGTVSTPSGFYLTEEENEIIIRFNNAIMARESDDEIKPVLFGRLFNTETLTFQEGRVYEFSDNERLVHRDESGNLAVIYPDYKRSSHILFAGSSIVHAWSEDVLFKFYDLNNNYEKAVYLPAEKIPVNKNDYTDKYDDVGEPWRSMIRNDNFPEFYPALKKALIDDKQRIWAGLHTEDKDRTQWNVISGDGSLLAAFEWPDNQSIMAVKNGFVYALETDTETELQQIVKYSINF